MVRGNYAATLVLFTAFSEAGLLHTGSRDAEHFVMGAIPMEDMDLVVSALTRTVGPNPLSPNIPHGLV